MALPIKEEKSGNWNNVSELVDFKIVKFAAQGLLVPGKADVMLLYKKKSGETDKEQKRLIIFGPEDAVFTRAMEKISEKKNQQKSVELKKKFMDAWNITDYSPSRTTPSTLLKHRIFDLGLNTKEFAEHAGIKSPSLYHHVSGGRDVDKDTAIKYAKKLGCDPVDLMFPKKVVPIWSKVNLLKAEELEDYYKPGKLFSYTIAKETDVVDYAYDETLVPLEKVVVPRDIYREDIKAIKIEARGSMYDNKVAFYYRASEKSGDYLNQLCVVGVEEYLAPPEISDEKETRYYFGLYNEVEGESNLINPDPYAKPEVRYILKNFNPKFIAPIIAIVNPKAVVDQTKLTKAIPQAALVNREEELKTQIEYYRNRAFANKEEVEKLKKNSHQSDRVNVDKANAIIKKLYDGQRKAESEVEELLAKVDQITAKINQEMVRKKISGGISDLFYKEQDALNKIHSMNPLKTISGGKK